MTATSLHEGYLVTHTHWDREWYFSVEKYRFRLVRMIDRLLDIINANPAYAGFWLDGQTVPIDDYLAVRPERGDELKACLKSGKIQIGPWFTLSDELLVNGESQFRNLEKGMETMRSYGQENLVGYQPDTFGHISQLPQILAGFGITTAVLWRGYDSNKLENTENYWQSPDGMNIRLVCLAKGYSNAAGLRSDNGMPASSMEDQEERIRLTLPRLKELARNGKILLMNGIDHSLPVPDLDCAIAELGNEFPEVSFRHCLMNDYLDANSPGEGSVTFMGELLERDGLESVLSNRQNQKNMLREAENLLLHYAEPIVAGFAPEFPGGFLERAWKLLLDNHSHDSVCGCHSDEVAQDVEQRFRKTSEICRVTMTEAVSHWTAFRADDLPAAALKNVLFYNPRGRETESCRMFDFIVPENEEPSGFSLDGQIPLQVVDCKHELRRCFHDTVNPTLDPVKVYSLISPPLRLAATSFKNFKVEMTSVAAPAVVSVLPDGVLDNEFLRVKLHPDGSLDMVDKKRNMTFPRQNIFKVEKDIGNLYEFKPECETASVTAVPGEQVHVVANGPIRATVACRFFFPLESGMLHGEMQLSLDAGASDVDICMRLDNSAHDFRLTSSFSLPPELRSNSQLVAHMPFDLVQCEQSDKPRPMHYMAALRDESLGFVFASRGLYELIYDTEGVFSVTMMRATGKIMEPLKIHNASSGQCLGITEIQWKLGVCDAGQAAMLDTGFDFNLPAAAFQTPGTASGEGIVELVPREWFLSAIRSSNDGRTVVRFFSVSDKETTGALRFGRPCSQVFLTRADGVIIEEINNMEAITVPPHGIVTVAFLPE